MTIEELQKLEREQYAEFCRLDGISKLAGRAWIDTREAIRKLEQEAEVERLVQERLNNLAASAAG